MLYTVFYQLDGIVGPSGYVAKSQEEIVELARPMAQLALDQMDDYATSCEWYDTNGVDADPRELLESDDIDEVIEIIAQISDTMKPRKGGFIDIAEFNDIIELIEKHNVVSWCSPKLRDQVASVHASLE